MTYNPENNNDSRSEEFGAVAKSNEAVQQSDIIREHMRLFERDAANTSNSSGIVTRFAPSPTGFLHIGGARTALFNILFARHYGGKFLLRIEDTDRQRSTDAAIQAIFDGLEWLGLKHDEDAVFQFARNHRHQEVAHQLVAIGKAYYCYCSQEEIQVARDKAMQENRSFLFESPWRDNNKTPPANVQPVVRIKAPKTGQTVINDLVQGKVTVQNDHLDDMVLLRADGTPTYMLAVVVDDHDMGITHIIRGDDHLNNAFRQSLIYKAMEWDIPEFAHIPLIHGSDGSKLSKRHGATNVVDYKKLGILPEAMNNYLMRLGWSYRDEEIISMEDAIKWFDIKNVGKSPSRFDMEKLLFLNSHYLANSESSYLINLISEYLGTQLNDTQINRLKLGMPGLVKRANTINQLAEVAHFYLSDEIEITEEAKAKLNSENIAATSQLLAKIAELDNWQEVEINGLVKEFCKQQDIKMGVVGEVIRIALTGITSSPSIFEMLYVLGKEESIRRISSLLTKFSH